MPEQPCERFERVNILGIGVSATNLQEATEQLACWIEHNLRTYVVVCPVYTLMQGMQHPGLGKIMNRAGMVTPDGMPLVFLSRWKGYQDVGRVYGPDLMLSFSEVAAEEGYSSYYFGGREGVPEKLAETLTEQFPGLRVAGTYSPPFRELTTQEEDEIAEMINDAAPDVVWVGLGSPKQDRWMARFRERLDAPVLIGVGAAFDFHTGGVRQAPLWMQRSALEWLFRLLVEPGRLWRRYLIYNPLFIWNVLLQAAGIRQWEVQEEPQISASSR